MRNVIRRGPILANLRSTNRESPVAERDSSAYFFVVKTWVGFEIPGWDEFVTLAIAAGVAIGIPNDSEKKDGFLIRGLAQAGP